MSALYDAHIFTCFCNGYNITNVYYDPRNVAIKLNFLFALFKINFHNIRVIANMLNLAY